MKPVAIAELHTLEPNNCWSKSLGDLALDAAAPLVPMKGVDALLVAAPSASFVQQQADFASIVADRLSIAPKIALTLDSGDASAAAALQVAWQCLRTGFATSALVVSASKVSDLSENERHALRDHAIDQEAERAAGLTFASQAGLLAARFCHARERRSDVFAETTAANLGAWARHKGRAAPVAAEIRRDLLVAPPLVRSDFAELLDGAAAVLLTSKPDGGKATIESFASAGDTVAIWERADPLAFAAVERAVSEAVFGATPPQWLELDTAASVVQCLAEDAVMRTTKIKPDLVNIRGGAQGRGRVWGGSLIYQLQDILECDAPFGDSLVVSVGGLGSRAFAARILKGSLQ